MLLSNKNSVMSDIITMINYMLDIDIAIGLCIQSTNEIIDCV